MKYVNIESSIQDWINPGLDEGQINIEISTDVTPIPDNDYTEIEQRNRDIFILDQVSIPGFGDYCTDDKYFSIGNVFSELKTEELRKQARINIDISWKNLLGDIELAPSLKDYILEQLEWNNIHGELNPVIITAIKEQMTDLTNYWEIIE